MEAPNEDRYLLIAVSLITFVPLFLAGYAYYYLAITYAQKNAVYAAQQNIRVLDIKPSHRTTTK
jgi:CBS domain containing-hemolysin-like protein